jgi:hypothetical protein
LVRECGGDDASSGFPSLGVDASERQRYPVESVVVV